MNEINYNHTIDIRNSIKEEFKQPEDTTKMFMNRTHSIANMSGLDISTINAMDLSSFRNSSFPNSYYWLLAVPIIGWIALACIKIYYVITNAKAEQILKDSEFSEKGSTEDKIKILRSAVRESGPLAWQYQLELVRLQLLNGENQEADTTLREIDKTRGSPSQSGWYNVKGKGLVTFEVAPGECWADGKNVIKITHHTAEEAYIHASVHAANNRLAAAYDSYNQAIYYDDSLKEKIRPLQVALVKKMQKSEDTLTTRALEIIEAEIKFTARQKQAREGIVGRL